MSEPLKNVTPVFTPTKSGAPSITIEYDENSTAFDQISLGIWLTKIKANGNQLVVEELERFSDGRKKIEIKVTGT